MKTFLALYTCAEDSQNHEAWKQLTPEMQAQRMQAGMAARERWLEKYEEQIVSQGSSLGEKTKLVDSNGVHDLPRQMGAFIIVQRAVTMLQGKISRQNNPGRGCGFRIEVPKVLVPVPANRAVEGLASAHPKPSRL